MLASTLASSRGSAAALTRAAATLGTRIPRIRDPRLAVTIAHGLDTLLCNITTGYNALELAIGDSLAALEVDGLVLRIGQRAAVVPDPGARVQSSSSAFCGLTQTKLAASSMLPRPLYC